MCVCVCVCVFVCVEVAAGPAEAKSATAPYVLGYWNTRVSIFVRFFFSSIFIGTLV